MNRVYVFMCLCVCVCALTRVHAHDSIYFFTSALLPNHVIVQIFAIAGCSFALSIRDGIRISNV